MENLIKQLKDNNLFVLGQEINFTGATKKRPYLKLVECIANQRLNVNYQHVILKTFDSGFNLRTTALSASFSNTNLNMSNMQRFLHRLGVSTASYGSQVSTVPTYVKNKLTTDYNTETIQTESGYSQSVKSKIPPDTIIQEVSQNVVYNDPTDLIRLVLDYLDSSDYNPPQDYTPIFSGFILLFKFD